MATKDEILSRLLKEENYVSGEELARQNRCKSCGSLESNQIA